MAFITVSPADIKPGDRFTHKGMKYEATEVPQPGKYSVYRVRVRRVDEHDLGIDYNHPVRVDRQ